MSKYSNLGYEIYEPMKKTKEYSFDEVALIAFLTLFITAVIVEIFI